MHPPSEPPYTTHWHLYSLLFCLFLCDSSVAPFRGFPPVLAFQTWNFIVCALHKDLRAWLMLLHHALVVLFCVLALHPFLHAGCVFFYGVLEVSSLFLAAVSIFKVLNRGDPEFTARFASINSLVRALFAVSFGAIRIVAWPFFCHWYWTTCMQRWSVPAHQPGALHSHAVVAVFLGGNAIMTMMQLQWGYIIFGRFLSCGGGGGKKASTGKGQVAAKDE